MSASVALRKCLRSGPLSSPMPMKVDSCIGCASLSRSAPSFQSIERQRMDRAGFLDAAGMIGMIMVLLPKLNFTSVLAPRRPHHAGK